MSDAHLVRLHFLASLVDATAFPGLLQNVVHAYYLGFFSCQSCRLLVDEKREISLPKLTVGFIFCLSSGLLLIDTIKSGLISF